MKFSFLLATTFSLEISRQMLVVMGSSSGDMLVVWCAIGPRGVEMPIAMTANSRPTITSDEGNFFDLSVYGVVSTRKERCRGDQDKREEGEFEMAR